ncbi:MAG: hypothetical protein ATN35_07365 [Epulopiscium sp. Nele67-Bin004]|nr:MAG: hypothetical protein ATN35_07365 [Epulopiscium sp. Nele67-Bin004]
MIKKYTLECRLAKHNNIGVRVPRLVLISFKFKSRLEGGTYSVLPLHILHLYNLASMRFPLIAIIYPLKFLLNSFLNPLSSL